MDRARLWLVAPVTILTMGVVDLYWYATEGKAFYLVLAGLCSITATVVGYFGGYSAGIRYARSIVKEWVANEGVKE